MPITPTSPLDTATDVAINSIIDWTDSVDSDSYKVYFGTSSSEVTSGDADVYRGDVTDTEYDPRVLLTFSTVYYWRVDAVLDSVTTTGSVYSFTVAATAATITSKKYKKRLIALADDQFWYEDISVQPSKMIALGTFAPDTSEPIDMIEAFQKVFIVNGATKTVVDFINIKMVASAWTGAARPTRGMIMTGDESSVQIIVDFYNGTNDVYGFNFTSNSVTSVEDFVGTNEDGDTVTFTITGTGTLPTIPHYYTWTPFGAVTDTTDAAYKGDLPTTATVLALYRGGILMAGDTKAPHSWALTRRGNPFDFLFQEDDEESARAGANSKVGQIGDVVISLMPHGDDYVVFGSSNSIWLMSGDPAGGGSLDPINETIGIMGPDAWCKDGDGNTYVFGTNGIYRLAKNLGSFENLTMDKIPTIIDDLNIDADQQIITMGYDGKLHGLVISVTSYEDGSNEGFWYDLRTGGFFPESYPDDFGIYSQHYYKADETEYKRLMAGCADGFIRTFDPLAKNDDTTAIDSYAVLGPTPLNPDDFMDNLITDLVVTSGGGAVGGSELDTDGLTVDMHVKDTSEEVTEDIKAGATPQFTYTHTGPGRGRNHRPKRKGLVVGVKLSNSTVGQTWGVEKVTIKHKPAGRKK